MSTGVESALLALAGKQASKDLKSRSKWTDRLAIVDLFMFAVLGTTTMAIGAVYGASNNLKEQSALFKTVYTGGYIILAIGGLLALASHWHWFGYNNSLNRDANKINAIPAIMGVMAFIAIGGGIAMILTSVFIIMEDK